MSNIYTCITLAFSFPVTVGVSVWVHGQGHEHQKVPVSLAPPLFRAFSETNLHVIKQGVSEVGQVGLQRGWQNDCTICERPWVLVPAPVLL